jgi:hypothetical protein
VKVADVADKIALVGYRVALPYDAKLFNDKFQPGSVYRPDNLAAFGAGKFIAQRFMALLAPNDDAKARKIIEERLSAKGKTAEQLSKDIAFLAKKMEQVLRDVFSDNKEFLKALEKYVDRYENFQKTDNRFKIGVRALSFTPLFGGFNYNSLDKKGVPIFAPTGVSNSVAWSGQLRAAWKKAKDAGQTNLNFPNWLRQSFEDYSKANGLKVQGVTYPP